MTCALAGVSLSADSLTIGSRAMTICPTVLAPCGVMIRKSRTPGHGVGGDGEADLGSWEVRASFPAAFSSSPSFSAGTTSPLTPSPATITWYAPCRLYRALTSCSVVCPICAAAGLTLISIG